jgi:hypothetical protein
MESPDELYENLIRKGKGNFPQMESPGKLTEKGFGIKAFQSVIRAQKRIQNPPRQRCQNVIAQTVGWENPDPIHEMVITVGESTHCHLR